MKIRRCDQKMCFYYFIFEIRAQLGIYNITDKTRSNHQNLDYLWKNLTTLSKENLDIRSQLTSETISRNQTINQWKHKIYSLEV